MDSVGDVVLSVLVTLALMGVFLTALFHVVSAAVEQGVRRALPASALKPSVRELLAQQRPLPREDEV